MKFRNCVAILCNTQSNFSLVILNALHFFFEHFHHLKIFEVMQGSMYGHFTFFASLLGKLANALKNEDNPQYAALCFTAMAKYVTQLHHWSRNVIGVTILVEHTKVQ